MGDHEHHKSEDQDKIDHDVVFSDKLKFVNALDPARNKIGKENLKKFLSKFDYTFMDRSKPKGPDYLIIDNVAKFFKLNKADLTDARKEAEEIANFVCKEEEAKQYARCDSMTWLKNLETHEEAMPALSNIAKAMANFRPKLNAKSQELSGDKTLRVDKQEVVLTRHNGASVRKQSYRRHKDSYVHDINNIDDGQELRKLTLVVFLNDDIEQVRKIEDAGTGMLRLYPNDDEVDGVVDISPRLGRAVLFKSEDMIHQVLSSHKWDNYFVTFHFT